MFKKCIAAVLIALFVFMLPAPAAVMAYEQATPVAVVAATTTTTTQSDVYLASMQNAIDNLRSSLTLTITDPKYDYTKFEKVLELAGVKSWTMSGEIKGNITTLRYKFEWQDGHAVVAAYNKPALRARLTERQRTVLDYCKQINASLIKEGMTDYEKVLAIHDYIVNTSELDVETARTLNTAVEDPFTAYGALINKLAVCQGYTEAAYILLWMAGIENYRLENNTHTWNLVKMGDGYYHIDFTWDDPAGIDAVQYSYFGLTDEQISKYAEHEQWANREHFPAATATEYNYFTYNNLYAGNLADIKKLVTEAVGKGQSDITIWVADNKTHKYNWQTDLRFIFQLKTNQPRRVQSYYYSVPNEKSDTLYIRFDY